MSRKAKLSPDQKRYLDDMKSPEKAMSQLGAYLNHWRGEGPEGAQYAETLEADLIETFTSESGLRVLRLFEKSILLSSQPNGAPEGALRETNAVRNFVLELRRIVSNA